MTMNSRLSPHPHATLKSLTVSGLAPLVCSKCTRTHAPASSLISTGAPNHLDTILSCCSACSLWDNFEAQALPDPTPHIQKHRTPYVVRKALDQLLCAKLLPALMDGTLPACIQVLDECTLNMSKFTWRAALDAAICHASCKIIAVLAETSPFYKMPNHWQSCHAYLFFQI